MQGHARTVGAPTARQLHPCAHSPYARAVTCRAALCFRRQECTYRRVLEDDGKGRRKLEIGHRAVARFLFLSVSFETHLYVDEDDVQRTIHFRTAREGVMKKFDGCWRIQPFTQQTLDSWFHPELVQQPPPQPQFNLFASLPFLHHQHASEAEREGRQGVWARCDMHHAPWAHTALSHALQARTPPP